MTIENKRVITQPCGEIIPLVTGVCAPLSMPFAKLELCFSDCTMPLQGLIRIDRYLLAATHMGRELGIEELRAFCCGKVEGIALRAVGVVGPEVV